ncbi:MAG TPA: biopolymer transporter ExbD [Pseudomonadota bacterium]|nr:biopolymer transporter ExbD [Pseudomonadota bacterium]HRI50772.1 biopolymer transporter ExbD [Pseudomonadota bacterium]
MAGGAVTPSGKGGRKPLDASINLVPFIDLLSCCISFLLITAVWVNLSQVPVRHGKDAASSETQPPTPAVRLTLNISADEYVLSRSTGESTRLATREGILDYEGLAAAMRQIKRELPDEEGITVRSADGVLYEHLIKTIDVLRSERFSAVHVTDAGSSG